MKYYFLAWKNYAKFSGRATRSEYWYFVLFHFICLIAATVVDKLTAFPIVYPLYALAVLIPSLALIVRRVHDTNHNGWFCIVPIYNLVLACTAGTDGENEYGPDPLKPEYQHFLEEVQPNG